MTHTNKPAPRPSLRAILCLTVLAALVATLALSCEDTITTQLRADVQVAALPDRTLTIQAPIAGSVTPAAGAHSLKEGLAFSISTTPAGGYTFYGWQQTAGSGIATFANSMALSTTVTVTNGDVTIFPAYSTTSRTLTLTNDGHGTVSSPSSPATIGDGVATSISATPAAGWAFDAWVKTAGIGNVVFGNANNASTTVTVTNGDATIQATFKAGNYMVNVSAGAGGTVSPSGSVNMLGGNNTTAITASASTDYQFKNWSASPSGVLTLSPNSITAAISVKATANANLTANFELRPWGITYQTVTGGAAYGPATVTATQPATIYAYRYTGYMFSNWTYTGAGTVTFSDANSPTTTIRVSGGAVTLIAHFIAATNDFTPAGTYSPGTSAMPSYFTSAAAYGDYLAVVGTTVDGGTSAIVRSVNIQAANNMYSPNPTGYATFSITSGYQYWGIGATTNGTKLWVGTAEKTFSGTLASPSDLTSYYPYTGNYYLTYNFGDSKLWGLTTATNKVGHVVTIDQTTFAPEAGGYDLSTVDDNPVMSIDQVYPFGWGSPCLVIGRLDEEQTTGEITTRMAEFGTGLAQTTAAFYSDDITNNGTNGWDYMSGAPEPIAISPMDDYSQVAVVAHMPGNEYYLRFYDISGPFTTGGWINLGGSSNAVTANCVDWIDGVPAAVVGGTKDGKATFWIINGNNINSPVLINTWQLSGYATVFWIGMGPDGRYRAVVKKTLAGTDKLEVVALTPNF